MLSTIVSALVLSHVRYCLNVYDNGTAKKKLGQTPDNFELLRCLISLCIYFLGSRWHPWPFNADCVSVQRHPRQQQHLQYCNSLSTTSIPFLILLLAVVNFRTIPSSPRLKSHCFVNVDVVVCPNTNTNTNFSARVITGRTKFDHISDVQRELGWLSAPNLICCHTLMLAHLSTAAWWGRGAGGAVLQMQWCSWPTNAAAVNDVSVTSCSTDFDKNGNTATGKYQLFHMM